MRDIKRRMKLVIDESDMTPYHKAKAKKRLDRLAKRGGQMNLDTKWVYRLVTAGLMLGDLDWVGYEYRSKLALDMHTYGWIYPKWDGKPRKCLVMAEQGIGDEILFASTFNEFLKDCPDATIECDPRLIPVFERNFDAKFVDRHRFGYAPRACDYPKEDYECFVMMADLLRCYRTDRKPHRKPYIEPLPKAPIHGVGLSWEGGRSVLEPEWLMKDDVEYVSVQYEKNGREVKGATPPEGVLDPGLDHNDMEAVFSTIGALDKVYTTWNYIVHVCGSIGKECHAIRPPYTQENTGIGNNRFKWNYGIGDVSWPHPWYESVTVWKSYEHFRRG
ncbi:MAG: hypothetical protein GWN62_06865 [Aliifodinibius sp.]|nr:hypothetical protein [Fodinibius sp.]